MVVACKQPPAKTAPHGPQHSSNVLVQVVWLRHFLGHDVVEALKWLGLRPLPATAGALENALRVKVLILIAAAFKRRSQRCAPRAAQMRMRTGLYSCLGG